MRYLVLEFGFMVNYQSLLEIKYLRLGLTSLLLRCTFGFNQEYELGLWVLIQYCHMNVLVETSWWLRNTWLQLYTLKENDVKQTSLVDCCHSGRIQAYWFLQTKQTIRQPQCTLWELRHTWEIRSLHTATNIWPPLKPDPIQMVVCFSTTLMNESCDDVHELEATDS